MTAELEIAPAEVKRLIDSGEAPRLIDVREPHEHRAARIEGAELIPMRSVPENVSSLASETGLLVVFCHHGVRSLQVVEWLRRQGVKGARSMAGGIDRWSREIDASVPRY